MELENIKYHIRENIKLFQYKHRNHLKFIPIAGIMFYLYLNMDKNLNVEITGLDMMKYEIINSFNFSDVNRLINTFLLILIVFSTYKYWLINKKVVRRNMPLTQGIIFVMIVLIFSVHIRYDSMLGKIFDWGFFFICLYLILAMSWFVAKSIDSLNLESDLYCWGIRLVGIILVGIGFLFTFTGFMSVGLSSGTDDYMNSINLFWIFGCCMILLGAFAEFRSLRRYGTFVYLR